MGDLRLLPDLKTLKLCLPTAKALQQFLGLERYRVPIYSNLWNYRFMIGHCEQLPFSVPLDNEENFLKLEKCVKYMNGDGHMDIVDKLIRNARGLYLRRHWTIEKLSVFDMMMLKYCLLMECNEMKALIDHEDLYKHKNKSTSHSEDEILGSLQYLSIHFMKKLQRISTGRIGKNSLSCLRILALHTYPELTSIFTGCLVENMQSLTELIVEDCPKINCLINFDQGTPRSNGPFLQNLRRVSLLDLPGLVSISGGVCIAPKLDTLLVFNCMKLDYLSVMELPRGIKAIKGEVEWWDALKYGKLTWHRVFIQLKRDGGLMDQLAEDTNSLQHFIDLKRVPSRNGNSLQINQNLSGDTKEGREHVDQLSVIHNAALSNETLKPSTQNILNLNHGPESQYVGTAFRMWEPPCPVSEKPHKENADCDFKASNHKLASTKKKCSLISFVTSRQIKMSKGMEDRNAPDDGYIWRKYGQKELLGSKFPRAYYRCSFRNTHNCCAKKQVQRSNDDPSVFEVTYTGKHKCTYTEKHKCNIVLSNNCFSTTTETSCTTLRTTNSPPATESASTIFDSLFEFPEFPQLLD